MPGPADKEDWSGMEFANNWEIIQKFSCPQYRKIYIEMTGDTTKIIKNAHYLVRNNSCGISTYMERTVIQRAINNQIEIMSKCKGCNNNNRLHNGCYYEEACRIKNLTKIPNRNIQVEVGKIYGNFLVKNIKLSEYSSDHQCRAIVECIHCHAIQERRFDQLLNYTISCDCFRPHSSGETIIKFYLEDHNIPYKTEYTFDDLYSPEGGKMRYDFAILKNNLPIALIEFDGQQHFQEAGSFYNQNGTVQIHDKLKNQYAKNNNIPLLRISYTEILSIYKLIDDFLIDFL